MLHGEHNFVIPKTECYTKDRQFYNKRIFFLFILLKKNNCIFQQ